MIQIPGIGSLDTSDRVDSGSGTVHERTVEFGNTVIVIHNIGTMMLVEQKRDLSLVLLGGVLALLGLLALQIFTGFGLLLIAVGGALALWALNRALDVFLSISTCDGRSLHLVSKDRQFLCDIRTLLRLKIDENSTQTATINISAKRIDGGLAIGSGAQAAGRGGTIHGGQP